MQQCGSGQSSVYERYADALVSEFAMRCRELAEPIRTVYFGGGTPSALPADLLERLVAALLRSVEQWNGTCGRGGVSLDIEEVTIEANPEDITAERIESLRRAGVNRISIGVQAFDTKQLHDAGRAHDSAASLDALRLLSESGINYSADLIYGLPGQTVRSWHDQLNRLLEFRPPHISCYLLSYEPGTRLYAQRERGRVAEADEATATEMYRILCEQAEHQGYTHYEISNFALPGWHSRHNSSYWNLTPYLGLGCSAHSFDGRTRRFNPSSLIGYLSSIEKGKVAAEVDDETLTDQINDYIITSMRTSAGLSLPLVKTRWGSETLSRLLSNADPYLNNGRLQLQDSRFVIPEHHWLMADAILRDLILADD